MTYLNYSVKYHSVLIIYDSCHCIILKKIITQSVFRVHMFRLLAISNWINHAMYNLSFDSYIIPSRADIPDIMVYCSLPKIPLTSLFFNPLAPNNMYICRTTQLNSRRCILNIYSTNILTEYFKHAAHSPFFFQAAVYFIMLPFLVPVIFAFYIQVVLKF